MKANPGGQLAVDEVIGREDLINEIWDTLENQSVILVAERRIGKTTVMQVMEAKPKRGWKVVLRDVEECQTAMEFAKLVYQDVEEYLGGKDKLMRRCSELIRAAGGTKIGGVLDLPQGHQVSWKKLLKQSIQDLVEASDDDEKLVMMWDEIPYMIDNIRKEEGAEVAVTLLDTLRSLRQERGTSVRMIYTGSIGLHHVFKAIKKDGYGNSPKKNDMESVKVDVLGDDEARELAVRLLKGEGLWGEQGGEIADELVSISSGFGYYIHCIVKGLRKLNRAIVPEDVDSVVESKLLDGGEDWDLDHYKERLEEYYGDEEELALATLDTIALSSEPLDVDEIVNGVNSRGGFGGKKTVRKKLISLMKLLRSDHYLVRTEDRKHRFLFPLIQRWWVMDREL